MNLCENCTEHVPLSHCVFDIFGHCDDSWRNHLIVPLTVRQYINQDLYRPTHCNDGRALDQPVVLWEDGEIKLLQDGAVGTARERRGGGEGCCEKLARDLSALY